MTALVPLLASVVTFVFALAVLDQFLLTRRDHLLLWAVGLFAWSLGTFGEVLAEALGPRPLPFRLWYVGGAVVTAAWLGMGSLALVAGRRRWLDMLIGALALATAIAAFRVFTAPVDIGLLREAGHLSGEAVPSGVRAMTPFFNVFGTLALVGVAVRSAFAFHRRRDAPHRVQANILIAVGALLPAIGGSLQKLGSPQVLYLTELLGAVVIFLGFLRSQGGLHFYPFLYLRRALDRLGLPEGLQ